MPAVISYDVSTKQKEVKALMCQKGYSDKWANGATTYNLPNTTLYHPTEDPAAALASIESVTKALGVRLERAVALPAAPWFAITGDAHV